MRHHLRVVKPRGEPEAEIADRSDAPRTAPPHLDLGDVSRHEQSLANAGTRKSGGVYYTPPDVVERLLDLALEPLLAQCAGDANKIERLRVLDPSCGDGRFLTAAGSRIRRALQDAGLPSEEAAAIGFGRCVVGVDIDEAAIGICTAALMEASEGNADPKELGARVICGDTLEMISGESELFGDPAWRNLLRSSQAESGFHLVIGNPPFLSQLSSETARLGSYTERLRQRLGPAVGGLTDTAALFLLLAVSLAQEEGGVICLIQPVSVLSAKESRGARSAILESAGMSSAWICEEEIFDAAVRVFAPVLIRGKQPLTVKLFRNRLFDAAGTVMSEDLDGSTWSPLLATSKGLPERQFATDGTLRDIATSSADFRDQYYGLRGCVVDREEGDDSLFPPLLTSGLLDPAEVYWGTRTTKFDKTKFRFPRVDMNRLTAKMNSWAKSHQTPKVLLATQTRILEVYVDIGGRFIPSVPVLTVLPKTDDQLWLIGALLNSPPTTLTAARRHLGAAMSTDALKLSAADVLELPLPADHQSWSEAAECFKSASMESRKEVRRTHLEHSAQLMCKAFGDDGDSELIEWWRNRLPTRRD